MPQPEAKIPVNRLQPPLVLQRALRHVPLSEPLPTIQHRIQKTTFHLTTECCHVYGQGGFLLYPEAFQAP